MGIQIVVVRVMKILLILFSSVYGLRLESRGEASQFLSRQRRLTGGIGHRKLETNCFEQTVCGTYEEFAEVAENSFPKAISQKRFGKKKGLFRKRKVNPRTKFAYEKKYSVGNTDSAATDTPTPTSEVDFQTTTGSF